jgi:hypothetical protein
MCTFAVIQDSLMFSEIMSSNTPDPDCRNYTMPPGDLNRTPSNPKQPDVRVNGKIRTREVRVIGEDGTQVGVISLADALALAKAAGIDLVEVSGNAKPPVCRPVDFGKYCYELSKKGNKSD